MPLSQKVAASLIFGLCLLGQSGAATPAPKLPRNIVLIMADDLGIEGLGCYGGTDYQTPNLDRLAATGIRFTHAYAQPLCSPTRLELMTGRYNQRNWEAFGILTRGEKTFGHLMGQFGYRTVIAGKWQLTSYDPVDFPGASQRRDTGTHPAQSGFEDYSLFHAEEPEDMGSRYADPTYLRNGILHTAKGEYGEDLNVDFIVDFMTRHRTEPMFVYYPMVLPHSPFNPTPHSDAWHDPTSRLATSTRNFKDMVEYVDTIVGRLVAAIDHLGLRDDTLILFYADNGTDQKITSHLGTLPVPGGKGLPTQAGIRVPLIANWPGGTPAGVVNADLIDATDFLPTLAALVGRTVPAEWHTEGNSFAPQLLGERNPHPRDWCFFWYDPRPGSDKEQFTRSIFALDHHFKLFRDGRLFALSLLDPTEQFLDPANYTPAARAAQAKLTKAMDRLMQPPLAPAALTEVDATGKPIKR